MQVIHNRFLSEYYCVDKDKKFTIQFVNKEWSCSCYQNNCQHIRAVQTFLEESKCQRQ